MNAVQNETYQIVNGKWTMNGRTYDELTLLERRALGEHVSYFNPKL